LARSNGEADIPVDDMNLVEDEVPMARLDNLDTFDCLIEELEKQSIQVCNSDYFGFVCFAALGVVGLCRSSVDISVHRFDHLDVVSMMIFI